MKRSEVFRSLICVVFGYEETKPVCDLGEALEHYTQIVREELQEELRGGATENVAPAEKRDAPEKLATKGPGAKEKQKIYARMRAVRDATDSGIYEKLAKATNGELTAKEIMKMTTGTVAPLPKWEVLNAAIDLVQKEM